MKSYLDILRPSLTVILLLISLSVVGQNKSTRLSKISGIQASFDSLVRDNKKKIIVLKGNVQVVLNKYYLYCDEAKIYSSKKELVCDGHVILQSQEVIAEAERMRLNYETNTGALYKAFVQSGQIVFNGEVIYKLGENDFRAINGSYTACTTCPPAWSFSGERIDATLGQYAEISSPIIRFADLPVLWSPVNLVLPLKTKRQSGVLIPSLDYSDSGGWAFNMSYFWAINRSQDATTSLKYYQHRGAKPALNYRYVLSDESRGELDSAFIRDRFFGASLQDPQGSFDRWFIKYNHSFSMPGNFVQKTRVNLVSDLLYPRDFSEDIEGHGDPSLENRFSLTHNTAKEHWSVDTSFYVNLLKADPFTENTDAVHRVPEIRYSLTQQKLGESHLNFNFDAVFSTFFRNYFTYDDLETVIVDGKATRQVPDARDGEYNLGDLIRTGERLDLQPRLTYPFHLSKFDLLPSLSYRETWYQFGIPRDNPDQVSDAHNRRFIRAELSARTKFSRIFGDISDPKATRYKHEIEPQVSFTSIPWIENPDHPFFGSSASSNFNNNQAVSELDLNGDNGLQFDYFDRIYNRNLVSFSLSNHFVRRQWTGDMATYNRIATVRLSQSYDLYDASNGANRPLSDISLLVDVRLAHFETNTLIRMYPYHMLANNSRNVTNTSSRLKFINDRGHFLQVIFTQNYPISENNVEVSEDDRTESFTFSTGWSQQYVELKGEVEFNNVIRDVQAWSYTLAVTPPGECWGLTFSQKRVAEGVSSYHIDFLYNFDGRGVKRL